MVPEDVVHWLPSVVDFSERPFIDEAIARTVVDRTTAHSSTFRLNTVLLQSRAQSTSVPHRWLKLRLFQDDWQSEYQEMTYSLGAVEKQTVLMMSCVLETSHVTSWTRKILSEASVYVLVIERLSGLKSLLSNIVPYLEEDFPEPHMIPPFVCFTSFARGEGGEENVTWAESEEEEIRRCFHDLNLRVGIEVVSITEHLTQLKNQIYDDHFRETPARGQGHVQKVTVDPFKRVRVFLKRGLLVHPAPCL